MSISCHIGVTAASSAEAVAREVAVGLGATTKDWGTPEYPSWHLASPDWVTHVRPAHEPEPHEPPVSIWLYHVGPHTAPLYRLADRVYRHLVTATGWGLEADADLEDEYPTRSRPALA